MQRLLLPEEDQPGSSQQRLIPPTPEPKIPELGLDRPLLLSDRLVLRAPHTEDIDALARLANNSRIAEMVSRMPHPYTVNDAADFVWRANTGGMGKRVYSVTKATDGMLLGCCELQPHLNGKIMEIGYWLGEPHWNQGYATDAAHMLIDMGFRDFDIEFIDARCRVVNVASRRVIQKCGFQFQATGMAPSMAMGGQVAVEWYRLDRKTWTSLKSWAGVR